MVTHLLIYFFQHKIVLHLSFQLPNELHHQSIACGKSIEVLLGKILISYENLDICEEAPRELKKS